MRCMIFTSLQLGAVIVVYDLAALRAKDDLFSVDKTEQKGTTLALGLSRSP